MEQPAASTLIILALIGAIPGIIAAVFAGLALWKTAKNSQTLAQVAVKVDGMSSNLVAATKEAEFAKGKLDERDAERVHLSETPAPTPIVNGTDGDPLKVKLVKDKE